MPPRRSPRDARPPSGDARLALLLILAILCPLLLIAAAPDWWSTRGVIEPGAPADDYAVLNQGQLKNLATAAVAEFNEKLVGGAGADLTQMVASWQDSSVPRDDYAAVNVGQLKALAARFYDRLGQPYPWTGSTQPADDYALANIGQAKALFSFTVPTVFDGIVADPLWQTLQDILNGTFNGYLTAAQYAALLDLVQRMSHAAFIAALNAALAQTHPPAAAQQIAPVLAQAQSTQGQQNVANVRPAGPLEIGYRTKSYVNSFYEMTEWDYFSGSANLLNNTGFHELANISDLTNRSGEVISVFQSAPFDLGELESDPPISSLLLQPNEYLPGAFRTYQHFVDAGGSAELDAQTVLELEARREVVPGGGGPSGAQTPIESRSYLVVSESYKSDTAPLPPYPAEGHPIEAIGSIAFTKYADGHTQIAPNWGNLPWGTIFVDVLQQRVLLAPASPQQAFFGSFVRLLPVELYSDLNNDGQLTSADAALVGKPYAPGMSGTPYTSSAIEEERDKGTEFLFTNDDLSNGAWEKDDSTTEGKPGGIIDDDDVDALKISLNMDTGDVWLEHPAIDALSFYKTKECKPGEKVDIKESAKFALSSSHRLPDQLFVRADGPISFPTTNIQKDGDLVLKYQPTGGQPIEVAKMRFNVVKGVGALKYFQTSRDYIFENNTRLHVRERGYPISNPQTVFRVCTMREEATSLTPIETAQRSFVDSAQLCGIERVATRWDDLTVLINGNQVFFSSGLGKWGAAFQSIFGPLKPMTDKCHGRIIPNGSVNVASSDVTDTTLTPPGSALAGPLGRWVAKNGQSKWTFGADVVPDNGSLPQALGGLSTNYSGNPERNGEPTQNVGHASLGTSGKGCVFSATVTQGYGHLGDFAADARYSGVDDLPGSGTLDLCLLVLDSGDTSVALMHRNPNNHMKLIDKGTKHDGFPYFVNTYLGFTAQKPR